MGHIVYTGMQEKIINACAHLPFPVYKAKVCPSLFSCFCNKVFRRRQHEREKGYSVSPLEGSVHPHRIDKVAEARDIWSLCIHNQEEDAERD